MLQLFRSDKPILVLFLFILGALFYGIILFNIPINTLNSAKYSFETLFNYINQFSITSISINYIITFITAIVLNIITDKFKLLQKNSFLITFFYLLFTVAIPHTLFINPILFNNFLLVLLINRLLYLPNTPHLKSIVFDVSFLVSLMSLFFFPAIFIVPVIIVGFIYFQSLAINDWIIAIIGLIIPYLFFFSYLFIFDELAYLSFHFSLIIFNNKELSLANIVLFGIVGLILILSFLSVFYKHSKHISVVRKSLNIIFFLFVILLIIGILYFPISYILTIIIIPLSIIVGTYFTTIKKVWLGELLIWILIGSIIFSITEIQ